MKRKHRSEKCTSKTFSFAKIAFLFNKIAFSRCLRLYTFRMGINPPTGGSGKMGLPLLDLPSICWPPLHNVSTVIHHLSPIYTICFDRHVSEQTKRHIAHTRVYTVCLTELSLNFPSKIISFVYIILTWRKIILLYLHVCWYNSCILFNEYEFVGF